VNFPFLCSPIVYENFIVAGDKEGWIYLFSQLLSITKKTKLHGGIYYLLLVNDHLYAFTSAGILYCIDALDFTVVSKIIIDIKPDLDMYHYKTAVFYENRILIGTGTGELLFITLEKLEIDRRLKLSDSPVSCSVYPHNKSLFIGTQDGEIIRIQKALQEEGE
jgi:hypothetical protein